METLLRAAEEVFADVGYGRATTNLIAARAGVSPGTLYQFYPNKEALAEGLAAEYAQTLEALHATVFHDKIATLPLTDLVDATVDPFLDFHQQAPAFEALLLGAAVSPELAGRIQILHDTVASRLIDLFQQRAPKAKPDDLKWAAEIAVGVFRGVLPIITPLTGAKRNRAVAELKIMLARYLAPVLRAQSGSAAGRGQASAQHSLREKSSALKRRR
jgi:AcrR family transcriptional regulator